LRRSVEAPRVFEDFADLGDIVDALWRWGISLPWAVELPPTEKPGFGRLLVVDCPVLACREPWFAVNALGDGLDDGPGVLVVVPDFVAQRGVAVGWAVGIAQLAGDRTMIAVALPTTSAEFGALQRLLEVAYSAAFDHARERD
jgi:hypothetical protein